MTRKVRLSYAVSFAVSVVSGYLLDFFNYILSGITPENILPRAGVFIAGLLCMFLGIGSFMNCSLPLMPYDIFLREFVSMRKSSIRQVKTAMDISFVVLACVFSFLFFSEIRGIGAGTIVSAALVGSGAGFVHKTISERISITALSLRGEKSE
jgi:uncharacterized membrane protein YczE